MNDWKSTRWLVKTILAPLAKGKKLNCARKQDEIWCRKEINVKCLHNRERKSLSKSLLMWEKSEKSHREDEIQRLQYAHQLTLLSLWPNALCCEIIGWDKKFLFEFIHIHPDTQKIFCLFDFAYSLDVLFLISEESLRVQGCEKSAGKNWWIIWRKFHPSLCEFISTSSAFLLQQIEAVGWS